MIINFSGLEKHINHIKQFADSLDIDALKDISGITIVNQVQERFETQTDIYGKPFPSPKSKNTLAAGPGKTEWGISRGILVKAITYEKTADGVVIGDNIPYSPYIHFGTGKYGPEKQEYTITPKRSRVLRFIAKNKVVFARKVKHPGIRPAPFYGFTKENRSEIEDIINNWINKKWRVS